MEIMDVKGLSERTSINNRSTRLRPSRYILTLTITYRLHQYASLANI